MGLDTVEIVLAVEDHFEIDIADEEAEVAVSVGDVVDLVVRKLETGRSQRAHCHSIAFFRLRRALKKVCFVPRSDVRPDALLEALLPLAGRKALWLALADQVGVSLPPLVRTAPAQQLVDIAFAAPAVTGFIAGLATGWRWDHLLQGITTGVVARALTAFATRRSRIWVPPSCSTVEGLVHVVAARLYGRMGRSHTYLSREKVLQDIIDIASVHLGIPKDQIHAHSLWVDDLRAE